MRSLFVLIIILGMVPLMFRFPQVGVLMWSWVSLMNPHKMTWGVAQTFHVADIVAIATLGGLFLSNRERKLPIYHPLIVLIAVYALWTTITTIFAIDQDDAWEKWSQFQKILLFTFISATVMITKNRILALIWVISLSFGYFGIKGGLFTILSGGNNHVFGPPGSFIGANNGLAVALNMVIPLLRFLQLQTENKNVKLMLAGAIPLTAIAVLGTQSRAGMLALAAMLFFFLLKSRKRVFAIFVAGAAVIGAFVIMPSAWQDRMEGIQNYETDGSAQGRMQMWKYAMDVAAERPIVGGGFEINSSQETFDRLLPPGIEGRAAHSAYFEVLGEHGYVGLLLFLIIGFSTFRTGGKTVRKVKGHADLQWAGDLSAMIQVSLVGYAVNSAFVNFAIFDFYWQLVALTAIIAVVVNKELLASGRAEAVSAADKRFNPGALVAKGSGPRGLPKF